MMSERLWGTDMAKKKKAEAFAGKETPEEERLEHDMMKRGSKRKDRKSRRERR